MSGSLRPGRIDTLSIRVGFVVKKRSNMCFPPVGEVTVCSRRQSLKTSRHSVECGKFAVSGGCYTLPVYLWQVKVTH